jgi:hypothetical protein
MAKTLAAVAVSQFKTEKERQAATVVARELQNYARQKMPMGCGPDVAEKVIREGLEDIKFKIKRNPQAYGVDPITAITVIAALVNIAYTLVKWFKGE